MRLAAGIIAISITISAMGVGAEQAENAEFYEALTRTLMDMGMTTGDFRIRHDYAEPDVFRLPLIDSLMHHPSDLLAGMDALARSVERDSELSACALTLWDAMSVEPETSMAAPMRSRRVRDIAGRLVHLSPPFDSLMKAYLGSLDRMAILRHQALKRVEADLDSLYGKIPRMLAPSPEYEGIDPFELHRLEEQEEALSDSVLGAMENVDMAAVAAFSVEALHAAGNAEGELAAFGAGGSRSTRYSGRAADFLGSPFSVIGDVMYMGLTPYGPVVIGDTSSTVYEGCFALIVDPGGNDVYNLTDDRNVHFRLILDRGGDDAYRSTDVAGVAGAVMGTSLILDLEGNDSYRSADISLGAGVCGIGAIDDRAGNDSYISGIFSQGAGFLGLGIVRDCAGHDTYVAGMQSQAFGYVMGSGLILEQGGNDTYHTRMARTDILRYDDHYLTLSQGCAFGSRPDYSGGIGLLVDAWGNDVYSSDIFGQGVAYWFAVGALIDRGGHDRYCSYQYAQGAGIHLAFGLLLDEGGDDGYISKGVSQGCGHDLSLGLLADFSGNDWYTATDLSQGAGNANGIGIIYDADGSDAYASKSEINVNGYGNYRREFGSIGVHLDRRGRDYYAARGKNGTLWESGRYGLGVDIPEVAGSPRGDIMVKECPMEERRFTTEELFILSSRGEPRFREWREYAFERMVEDTPATIDYLRTVLDTDDARERHTIKDILRRIGDPSVPMLTEALVTGSPRAKSEASWILGLIGSREAFDPLLDLSRSDNWKMRSSTLNAMGKLKDLTDEDLSRLQTRLSEVLVDEDEVFYVKKDAAYASGRQGICGLLSSLISALGDTHYAVRLSAAEAIRELSKAGCDDVTAEIVSALQGMDVSGIQAALHAAQNLAPAGRLDVAEAALAGWSDADRPGEVAIARLLLGIEPETSRDSKRFDALKAKLPRDSWKTQAFLATE